MKANIRRLLSMLLVLAMVMGMVPAVMAAEAAEVGTEAALVAAFTEGGSIKLTGDVELTDKKAITIPSGVTVTLDLNGQTLSSTNSTEAYIYNKGTLTVTDSAGGGKIDMSTTNDGTRANCINNEGNLTIEGGELVSKSGSPFDATNYTIYSASGNVTITGGTIKAENTYKSSAYALGLGGSSTVDISNAIFSVDNQYASNNYCAAIIYLTKNSDSQVTINSGSFVATMNDDVGASIIRKGSGADDARLTINGGTFDIGVGSNGLCKDASSEMVSITGGTFTNNGTPIDVSKYVAEGYTQSDNGTVSDGSTPPEQEDDGINTTAELQAAIDNAAAGATVSLGGPIALDAAVTVLAGKEVTLDLNGQTITSDDGNTKYIDNYGTLTVTDSVGGGKIHMSADGGTTRTNCIKNNGDLTIAGGELISTSVGTITNYTIFSQTGNVTITGGTISAQQGTANKAVYALGLGGSGTVEISDATFYVSGENKDSTSAPAAIIYLISNATPNITISSGSFEATLPNNSKTGARIIRENGETNGDASLTINGGEFNIDVDDGGITDGNYCNVTITGGTFKDGDAKVDVSQYVADGYTQVDSGAVVKIEAVSDSETFCEKMATGGYIQLTDSFVLEAEAEVPVGVTVTLDLNGQTITSNNGHTNQIVNHGTLTIVDSRGGGGMIANPVEGNTTKVQCVNNEVEGTLTINGGSFTANASAVQAYAVFSKGPSITINDGTFKVVYTGKSNTVQALGLGGTGSVATINDGNFITESSATGNARAASIYVLSDSNIQIIIEDGNFTSTRTVGTGGASIVRDAGAADSKITIKGGSFEATAGEDKMFYGRKGILEITGGTFTYDGTIFAKAPTTITGGTFIKQDGTKNDISEYVSDGYVQKDDGSVMEGPSVKAYASQLIAYYENYQNAAATDIQRVLEDMAVLDANAAAAWEKIMNYWSQVNEDDFVKVGEQSAIDANLPNDDSLCIVILGLALNEDGSMKEELEGRLTTGLALANAYPNAYVCVTGGGTAANNPNVTEGGLMGQWLLDKGLTESRLIIEDQAGSTVGNAKNTYTILSEQYSQVENIVLVTSDYHVARGSILYYTKFVLEAMVTGGEEIDIIANAGFDTNKDYESIASQATSMRTLTGANDVDVTLSVLESLTVTQDASYVTGNDLKLTVKANYDSGYSKTVDAHITGFDKTQGADQVVTISYTENDVTVTGEMRLTETYAVLVGTVVEVSTYTDLCDKVQNNCTVKLTAGFALEGVVEIPAGVTVVLDFNGNTVTSTSDDGTVNYIHNKGNLIVTDSSANKNGGITVEQTYKKGTANVQCINNDGALTVTGGNFTASSAGGTAYAVYSKGTAVTISGGNFTANYTNENGSYQAQTLGFGGTNAVVTIGGDVTVTATSVSESDSSRCATLYTMSSGVNVQVTVSGGTFISTRTVGTQGASILRAACADATVNITGGSFRAKNAGANCMFYTMSGNLNITGGTFAYDGQVFEKETANITGGTFLNFDGTKVCDVTAYITESYAQLDNGSVVLAVDAPTLAQIGDKAYKSLWEVFSKSAAGDTIILAADAKSLETIALSEAVILDLNGKTLEAPAVYADDSQIVDNTQSGLLQIPKGYATFNPNNSQLPVWDETAGGYRLAETKIQVKEAGANGAFYFRFDLTNAEWEGLLPEENNEEHPVLWVEVAGTKYSVPNEQLTALYADTNGRGAIKVTFTGWDSERHELTVGVSNGTDEVSGAVEVTKAANGAALTAVGPTGSVDTLAEDVRDYLAAADALYNNLTSEELDQKIKDETLESPKTADTSLYNSKQPVTFQWRWDDRKAIPEGSEFSILLSKTEDFAEAESFSCTHVNDNAVLQYEPIWNLETATTYYWRVEATLTDGTVVIGNTMTLTTGAGPRLLTIGGVSNARDLGGWDTGTITLSEAADNRVLEAGKTTQGLVYRSGRLEDATDEGIDVLINELGINAEIDLRNPSTETKYEKAVTCLEEYGVYYMYGTGSAKQYGDFITNPTVAAPYLRVFTDPDNYPIIFHCRGGADRTGSLAFILNALQGVSEADLIKDYEFTKNRMVQGADDGTYRDFPGFLTAFHALEGATTYDKARTFCRNAGLEDWEIDNIILLMRGMDPVEEPENAA